MNDSLSRFYDDLTLSAQGLLDGERDFIANSANFVALLHAALDDVNWVGIYRMTGDDLLVGPFQGKPACIRIPSGRGVCGAAASTRRTVIVDDVHAFDGHIACDPESRSEIVVPLESDGRLIGVLDVDSPSRARFSAADAAGLERLASVFLDATDVS